MQFEEHSLLLIVTYTPYTLWDQYDFFCQTHAKFYFFSFEHKHSSVPLNLCSEILINTQRESLEFGRHTPPDFKLKSNERIGIENILIQHFE